MIYTIYSYIQCCMRGKIKAKFSESNYQGLDSSTCHASFPREPLMHTTHNNTHGIITNLQRQAAANTQTRCWTIFISKPYLLWFTYTQTMPPIIYMLYTWMVFFLLLFCCCCLSRGKYERMPLGLNTIAGSVEAHQKEEMELFRRVIVCVRCCVCCASMCAWCVYLHVANVNESLERARLWNVRWMATTGDNSMSPVSHSWLVGPWGCTVT